MKVFISWSGELSHKVALVLRDWLPSVLQTIQPYVSSEDIEKGARWSTDVSKELESTNYGVLIVTKENLEAPWLNFEAGAISKLVDSSHVSPLLFDIKKSEVKGPLVQFQLTIFEKDDVSKLLHSINKSCEPPCVDEARLDKIIEVWWPGLENDLNKILVEIPKESESKSPGVSSREHGSMILEELLELVRNQQKILNNPEILFPPGYFQMLFRDFGDRYFRDDLIESDAIIEVDRRYEIFKSTIMEFDGKEFIPLELVKERLEDLGRPLDYILGFLMRRPIVSRRKRVSG